MANSDFITDLYSPTFITGNFDSYPELNLAIGVVTADIPTEFRAKAESSSLFNWDGASSSPTPAAVAGPSSSKYLLYFVTSEGLNAHRP